MNWLDGLVSIIALAWIIYLATRATGGKPRALGFLWIFLPILAAAGYRLLSGHTPEVVAAVLVVMLVAERRHLQSRLLELFVALAGILILGWILFTVTIPTAMGLIGVIVFWLSWEAHAIEGETAITLLTCLLVWPGLEFVAACAAAAFGWAVIARIREGGWLKRHVMPERVVVASSAIIYIGYLSYRLLTTGAP